jgi:hypothetical protein
MATYHLDPLRPIPLTGGGGGALGSSCISHTFTMSHLSNGLNHLLLATGGYRLRPGGATHTLEVGLPVSAISLKFRTFLILCETFPRLKDSVQWKLRWVKNSKNGWVLAWDSGTGHYFLFYLIFTLVLTYFYCIVGQYNTTQFIGEFWKNRWSSTSDIAPLVLVL